MPNIVLYDGDCSLCISIAGFLRRKDKQNRLRLIPLQSEEGKSLAAKTGLSENETNTVIYFTKGRFFLRSTAVLHILRELGGGWSILFIFIIIPRFIRDFIYRLIARNRHRFFGTAGT
jgi:predicted DCC family thiol-disulfide oxidoreductase YuxK